MPPVIKVEDQLILAATANYPYAKWKFEKFNPVQSRCMDFFDKEVNGLIAAMTSGGKAQPDDAIVLTPHGYRLIAELQVGEKVIGGDGNPTEIVGVFPQGRKLIYKVCFSDRTSTECCEDHLWAVRNKTDRLNGSSWRILPVSKIREAKPETYHIPVVADISFPKRELGLHPYVLGLLLGDGGVACGIKVTICDAEIKARFERLLPQGNKLVHQKNCDYLIVGDGEWNPVAYELSQLGVLGLRSYKKFIPWAYKYASSEQRKELVRGLMDSDGGCQSGKSPTFDITSKLLVEDMAFLIRSLGGWTKIRVKSRSTYRWKGEKRYGRAVYRLTVGLDFNPFSEYVAKGSRYRSKLRHPLRKIVAIELVGEKPCRCIKVQNEDGLYVTNDCIVTHNTVVAEMFLAQEIRKRGGKGMFLAPLRALGREKYVDWTNEEYHFGDLKTSICTGDYRLTKERSKELSEADLIIMTSEMLNHRSRNYKAEQNNWLKNVGTLVIDESHLLTVPGRGDHLEVGLMKFTEINPNARLVLLSATMPNVEEIADWVSYSLTKKDTFLIKSKFRPVPLTVHYEIYDDSTKKYDQIEEDKVNKAVELVEHYSDDKFLIFSHTKRTGELMKQALRQAGVQVQFHNADLEAKDREAVENQFRNDPKLRVIVATSTLAWGLNLPARRVIILGVHRGLSEVESHDIIQMVGRSGRLGIDPMGDAYILVPKSRKDEFKQKLSKPARIESQLLKTLGDKYKTLAFHLVSEIHHGQVETTEDVHEWYKRSLAYFQNKALEETVIDSTLESLEKCGAISYQNEVWTARPIGKISSMFYFSPFDVSGLYYNFKNLFENQQEDDEYLLSMALGNIDTHQQGIVSRIEREEMNMYSIQIRHKMPNKFMTEASVKAGFCYFNLLNGINSQACAAVQRNIQFDYNRVSQVLQALDGFTGQWGMAGFFKILESRITNGVPAHLVDVCRLPNIGKVKANKLYNAGFKTVEEIADANPEQIRNILNCKQEVLDTLMKDAKIIALT